MEGVAHPLTTACRIQHMPFSVLPHVLHGHPSQLHDHPSYRILFAVLCIDIPTHVFTTMSYAPILPQPPEGLEIDIMLEKRLQEAWSQRKQASIERLSDFIRFILLRQSSLPPKVIPRRQILRGLDHASIMLCGLSTSKNNIYNMRDFVFERLITSIAIFMKKEKLFAHDFHDKNINQAVMHCIYDDRIEHRFAKRFFAVFFKCKLTLGSRWF